MCVFAATPSRAEGLKAQVTAYPRLGLRRVASLKQDGPRCVEEGYLARRQSVRLFQLLTAGWSGNAQED